ncbi:MAG TPA: hypothetical protein VNK26_03580 [Pyrinomonadaceae bacterium]|jgi:hypothetical protein|nr:hypothetical protein [Pyrinomonadaceae bacterium]
MKHGKQELSEVAIKRGYEENVLGLRGILIFGGFLLVLIIATFFLMYVLKNQLEDHAKTTKSSDNPLALSDKERLPPEPRLQSAPGFGVDGPNGRINLELKPPQSEYWELKKIWDTELQNGVKDPKTGAVTALPIEEAKKILLSEGLPSAQASDSGDLFNNSKLYYSSASAGRVATERRR